MGVFIYPRTQVFEEQAGNRHAITVQDLAARGLGRRVQVVYNGEMMMSSSPAVDGEMEILLADHAA